MIPKSTDTLLINKDTGQPIGYVKKLSIHFVVDSILVKADWQVYRPPLPTRYYKGNVVSIKWTGDVPVYLTIEVSNVQEIKDETAQ